MIVRITFPMCQGCDHVMLFGDSYKTWDDQFEEYWRLFKNKLSRPIKIEMAIDKWKAWGGLKWCSEEEFQNELNREGCQEDDPDNPNPRQYSEMIFAENPKITKKVNSIIR